MDAVVSNQFELTASLDGTTYYSQIVPVSKTNGFFQFLDKTTGKCTPTWNDTAGPKFFQKIADVDGGDPVPEGMPKLFWNGTEVPFGNGVSAAPWAGYFRCKQETVQYGDDEKTRWVFQIVKDMFGAQNVDSDSFFVLSTIKDYSGNAIDVRSEPQKVECVQSSSGTGILVTLWGNDIAKGEPSTVLTAAVHTPTGDLDNVAVTFYKVKVGDDTQLVNGQNGYVISGKQLTVPKDDVNGIAVYRAVATVNGKQYEGYAPVKDLNDPYIIQVTEKHTSQNAVTGTIRKGDTVSYSGQVVDSSSGDAKSGLTVKFQFRDKNGSPIKDGVTSFPFNDVVKQYGGKISGQAYV